MKKYFCDRCEKEIEYDFYRMEDSEKLRILFCDYVCGDYNGKN